MVTVLGILRRPRLPRSPVTLPIWAHHGNQYFHKCTRYRPAISFLDFLIFEQNQDKVYHEVLIAGDLTKEDVARADVQYLASKVNRS